MKTTKLISGVVSILVLLVFAVSFAEEQKGYVPKEDEEIYGTWVNTDYSGGTDRFQKYVHHSDGRVEVFSFARGTAPSYEAKRQLTRKWADSEGNVWYEATWERLFWGGYELIRISKDGDTLESIYDLGNYSTEIDPSHVNYYIYHRE
jgi:hypothetical protein